MSAPVKIRRNPLRAKTHFSGPWEAWCSGGHPACSGLFLATFSFADMIVQVDRHWLAHMPQGARLPDGKCDRCRQGRRTRFVHHGLKVVEVFDVLDGDVHCDTCTCDEDEITTQTEPDFRALCARCWSEVEEAIAQAQAPPLDDEA